MTVPTNLIRRLIPGIVFGFTIFLALAFISDIREVSSAFYDFRWSLFPVVLALTLFNYTLRGIKFHYYLRLVGADDISLPDSFRLFVAGFPLAVTPGKVGEVLKGVWINNKTMVPTAKGIAVVVAERISDGLAVLLLTIFGVIAYPQYWLAFSFVACMLLSILIVVQICPLAYAILRLLTRIPILNRVSTGLLDFYEGSHILFNPLSIMIAVGLGIISWLGEGIGFFVILVGLGLPPNFEILSIAVFILSFSTVVGAVSALPGGLGAAEVSISGMLILLLEINKKLAAVGTLLIRFATLWFGVGIGLFTWLFSRSLFQVADMDQQPIAGKIKGRSGG